MDNKDRIEQWAMEMRDKNRQQIVQNSKHPRITKFGHALTNFVYAICGGASDIQAGKSGKLDDVSRALTERGFNQEDYSCETPSQLSPYKRKIAENELPKYR